MTFIEEIDKSIKNQKSNINVCKALGMDILAEKHAFAILAFEKAKQIYIEIESKKQNP